MNEWTEILICTPCALYHANGETEMFGDDADAAAELIALIDDKLYGIVVVQEDSDPFSTHMCDSCLDTLAGERHEALFQMFD